MPLYTQIEDFLLKRIQSGEMQEGDLIPTERQLADHFHVSRPTVRQALNNLVCQGYLTRTAGKGSYVTKPKILQEYTRFIESYQIEMTKKGRGIKTEVLEKQVLPADKFLAQKLELPEKEPLMYLSRLRYLLPSSDNRPILLTNVYLPQRLCPGLLEVDFTAASLYDSLEKNGIHIQHAFREIEIRLCTAEDSRLLQIPVGTPVFFIATVSRSAEGKLVEYSESIYPWDKNKFSIEISRP